MGEIPVTITPPPSRLMEKMSFKDRIKNFKASFRNVIESKKEFLIFYNPLSRKFIQFIFDHEAENIFLNIPLQGFSEKEYLQCKKILGELAVDVILGHTMALQEEYSFKKMDLVPETVEKIFLDVFHLPNDYSVNVEIF